MGKGRLLWLVVTALISLGIPSSRAAAETSPGYLEGSAKKLGRGVANLLTGPLELIREPYLVSQREGGVSGLTVGIVRGVVSGVIRELAGVIEVATFFVPVPKGFQPLVQPEFIYSHGDWAP